MEAKVDAIVVGLTKVDSMAEIKVMLHKKHGHFEVDTYTNPSAITDEGIPKIMARSGNFFKEMVNYFGAIYSHLGPHPPTPPPLKVNHTKPTTSILEGIGKKTIVTRN